eukprot:2946106-Ditylum_brightwellii.AAC.1
MADDEYSFDTVTTAFRSKFVENKSRDLCTYKYASGTPVARFSGITTLGLSFLLDSWHDGYGKGRISVQTTYSLGTRSRSK